MLLLPLIVDVILLKVAAGVALLFPHELPVVISQFGWLEILKDSTRSCSRRFSVTLKTLSAEKSRLVRAGPVIESLPIVPYVPATGLLNAAGLNHALGVGFERYGLTPVALSRFEGALSPVPAESQAVVFMGGPVC